MQWPACDAFAEEVTSLECRVIAPSDIEKFLVKELSCSDGKKKQIDEMENGVWIQPIRFLLSRKCDSERTQDKKNRGRHWVHNGAVAQHAMCTYVWVEKNECKICGGPGIEKRRSYHCKWWTNPRLQMSAEVSAFEHIR